VRLVGLVGRPSAQDLLLVLARVDLAQALRALLGGELRLLRARARVRAGVRARVRVRVRLEG
jgi:hypothetical protein